MGHETMRRVIRWLLAAAYGAAGALHLLAPAPFLGIVPGWVPMPEQVVAATGVAELAGAAGLLLPRTRRAAGWGLALYALCVWPANINHMLNGPDISGLANDLWYHIPRQALQPVLIWAALFCAGVVRWPARAGAPERG